MTRFRVSVLQLLLTNGLSPMAPEPRVVFAREADFESQIFDAVRCTNAGWMHDRVAISGQQITDRDTSGGEPGHSEMNCPTATGGMLSQEFTQAVPSDPGSRIKRAIYDRRFGLRPAASLSGFLPDGGRVAWHWEVANQ